MNVDQSMLDLAQFYADEYADCTRRKVGAIVTVNGLVCGWGVNAAPKESGLSCTSGDCPRGKLTLEECPPGRGYGNCIAVHAEVAAFRMFRQQLGLSDGASIRGEVVVYVNSDPCEDCTLYLKKANVSRVVVFSDR